MACCQAEGVYIIHLFNAGNYMSGRGRRGRDRMVVRFTIACAISDYHH